MKVYTAFYFFCYKTQLVINLKYQIMNLTFFFVILSIIIGYMLLDMFTKPKRQQTEEQGNPTSQLKINYAKQCNTLKQLHEKKVNQIKQKTISIHVAGTLSAQQQAMDLIRAILTKSQKSINIYLVKHRDTPQSPLLYLLLECLPKKKVITYNSQQGGVAVLRQLNCNTHLETDSKMLHILKQYFKNIWTSVPWDKPRIFPSHETLLIGIDELIEQKIQA